ncbi:type II restriction enzyme [Psychrobacter sp. 1Y11]|uniref:type II restriction enzyme n=1 Tax=Psychrobacter sp. 1Y11 TaxID=3457446 RepID=UPI003FD2761F
MSKSEGKNDIAWEKLFEEDQLISRIEAEGEFIIDSKRINKVREARLMTKFDSREDLPRIFKENKLAILPISRGSYKVGKFDIFHNFEDYDTPKRTDRIQEKQFPSFIETIDPNLIKTEPTAIYCANLCSILSSFTGSEQLHSTISGRMGSGDFDFQIQESNKLFDFEVRGSQIEIDAGYESHDSVYLVEAKNTLSRDFVVRQLYYPYRTWLDRITTKEIRNIYLTYSNGIFYIREYMFEDIHNPMSIKLLNSSRYSIITKELTVEYLKELLNKNLPKLDSQEAPFPQADDFNKVVNLCEELAKRYSSSLSEDSDENSGNVLHKKEIAEIYDFAGRQADYYANAAKYLGLVSIDNGYVSLTKLGLEVIQLPLTTKQIKFAELILSSKPFAKVLDFYIKNAGILSIEDVQSIVEACKIQNLNSETDTFKRRCLTVKSWVEWIFTQVKES